MWRHDWSWEAVTFGGRSPLFVKATDSDEDPDAGAGNSSDEDTDLEDEIEEDDEDEDEREAADENAAEQEEKKDDKRKLRFKSQEAAEEAYAEIQGHVTRLEQQIARLQPRQEEPRETRAEEPDEVVMARAIADSVDQEMAALPEGKRSLKATTTAIVREVLKNVKGLTARVAEERAQAVNSQEAGRREAEAGAQAALVKAGLDRPEHMQLLNHMVMQRRQNPHAYQAWITSTTPEQQFADLAQDVAKLVKVLGGSTKQEIRDANKRHREDADALDSGSRTIRSRREEADDAQEEEKGGSMLDALVADQRALRQRGRHFSTMVLARR